MTPAMITAIIAALPSLIQLIQNMITALQNNSNNNTFTESDVISLQGQVAQLTNMVNQALTTQMNSVAGTTPAASTAMSTVSAQ